MITFIERAYFLNKIDILNPPIKTISSVMSFKIMLEDAVLFSF